MKDQDLINAASEYLSLSYEINQLTKRKNAISALFKMEIKDEVLLGGYHISNKEVAMTKLDRKALSLDVDISKYEFIDYHSRLTVKAVS